MDSGSTPDPCLGSIRNDELVRDSLILDCAGKPLDLSFPQVMGILNITPDSFFDGGDFFAPESALARARCMVEEGAAIIDVGGESTRPGAKPVSVDQELDRVIPVIEAIQAQLPVSISIDTSKPDVMRAAVAAGAGMINDVRALQEDGALEAAGELKVPICLMHMQGEPRTMQHEPVYKNVVADVKGFLAGRIKAAQQAGISADQLLIDPGFGFGKALAHNLALLRELNTLLSFGLPILVGLSHKSMIDKIIQAPINERLYASIALASLAIWQGASIIRAHDVKATMDAIRIGCAVKGVN